MNKITLNVIVVITIIIVFLGVYFLTNAKKVSQIRQLSSVEKRFVTSTTNSKHDTNSIIQTSATSSSYTLPDEKIYTNSQWGLSFKYPQVVRVEEIKMATESDILFYLNIDAGDSKSFILIKKSNEQNLHDYVESLYKHCFPEDQESCAVEIPKLQYYKTGNTHGLLEYFSDGTKGSYYFKKTETDNYVYIFSESVAQSADHRLIEDILSSLKLQ